MSPEMLSRIVNKIVEGYKPDKIILFGSYAYGNPTEDSDIDLFIIKDDNRKQVDRFCEVRKLSRDVNGVSVMPIVFTHNELERRLKLEDDFILEIMNKGKILYERKQ